MSDSRISGLYGQSVKERIGTLEELGWLTPTDAELLRQGRHVLTAAAANSIIENVAGVFGLPFAIAPNFRVNEKPYIVPMVVEEPSIVAAASNAARLALRGGGFEARSAASLLAGQVHVTGIADFDAAVESLEASKGELLAAANQIHPRLLERGGGVAEIEVRRLDSLLAVHILVDTCDAMGANIVNTICESIAPQIAAITRGDVALCILSNLADRSLVTARVCYRVEDLVVEGMTREAVRDRIIVASNIAAADPYRAATHNKGIMNGIDAVAIATGNDWRAIEAGAHAYASMSGGYAPLATWSADSTGNLVGELCMPLKVGIVGGTLAANPAAGIALRLTGVATARELAELIAAVGLAQNFAAIRALATEGIQKGHMRLHERSASSRVREAAASTESTAARAAGKLILLGEHAVVYGRHALAVPIQNAVSAEVAGSDSLTVSIPDWGIAGSVDGRTPIGAAVLLIIAELGLANTNYAIQVRSSLPPGMGLGSSAALAVAIVRAFDAALDLGLDDARVNRVAFACEKLAHGTPSGVDNSLATYGKTMLFRNADELQMETLELTTAPPIVVACSSYSGSTGEQVAGVRRRFEQRPNRYNALFDEMDALCLAGAKALLAGDYEELGALMNIGHGLLSAIEVSTPELDAMVGIARAAGAAGAKLTGGGGGGSVVAMCPDKVADVAGAFCAAGYRTFSLRA